MDGSGDVAGVAVRMVSDDRALREVHRIRRVVFVEGQGVPPEEEWDGLDDGATHFLGTLDGEAVAAGRLLIGGNGAKVERVAVLERHRGKGIGRAVTLAIIDEALGRGATRVYAHVQTQAVGFYRKLGFVVEGGGETFDEAGIEHVLMVVPPR